MINEFLAFITDYVHCNVRSSNSTAEKRYIIQSPLVEKMFTTCTPRSCSYEYVLLSWLGGQQRGCSNVFGMNNKSSSIVLPYITIVCVDFFILFIVPSIFAPPGGLPSASLLKQKVYYSSQNRNDTDKYKGKAIFLFHWYHSNSGRCYRLKNFIPWNVHRRVLVEVEIFSLTTSKD